MPLRFSLWTILLFGLSLAAASKLPALESSPEESIARSLADQWGLTSWRGFLEIAGENDTVDSVLRSGAHTSLVVAVLGAKHLGPSRRNISSGQPFLDHSELDEKSARLLGLDALNRGASVVEAAIGRPLYPFILKPMDMKQTDRKTVSFAVWNVTSREVHIDSSVLLSFTAPFQGSSSFLSNFAAALPQQLSRFIRSRNMTSSTDDMVTKLVAKVVPISIALAVAAAGPPIWFCVACPIVLGLLAPFVFNFGFGSVASLICQHYNLPSQECNDLWYGAFAIAMVLSLASAIPIVYICQLPKCGRRA